MPHKNHSFYDPWPVLDYEDFKETSYLLHMTCQAIGKLKLSNPFESHWSNVAFWVTPRGLSSGSIFYDVGIFTINIDFIDHKIYFQTSWGTKDSLDIHSMSVAELVEKLFVTLKKLNISLSINTMPQEIPNPIAFEKDTQIRNYNPQLANNWCNILISTYRVLQHYHSHFNGNTPPIGFMWGTFDLRDARYNGIPVATTGINSGYIRRNAMNEAQIEAGWWSGNSMYPRGAFYSFTYPQPPGIEETNIQPRSAHWNKELGEFILDYDVLRQSQNPEKSLLNFYESTYQAGAKCANWDKKFIVSGTPL
jgi:hypothetical protein